MAVLLMAVLLMAVLLMAVLLMAFIPASAVPLQQPAARLPALAPQQFGPGPGRANAHITPSLRILGLGTSSLGAGRRRDAPAGQGGTHAQTLTSPPAIFGAQQQGGNAGGLRRQLQPPALPQIQPPHFAHHHGQIGAFQPLFHGPQALRIIPPPHQDQARRIQTKGRQTGPVQPPVGEAPQHLTTTALGT